jgi:RNA polymerase sigma-70 factor (ECF subfamily)
LRCLAFKFIVLEQEITFGLIHPLQSMKMDKEPNTISVNRVSIMAYENAFKTHFQALHGYAYTIVKDDMMAEEMVQNVFFKLWKNREQLDIQQSLAGYLYRAVYNESLNYIKHQKVKAEYRKYAARNMNNPGSAADTLKMKELRKHLDEALQELPEKCRTIFQMSRFENLKYLEIANKLEISVKTVENQMGKALRVLRIRLADFLPAFFYLLMNL